jgi:hypothetical protein
MEFSDVGLVLGEQPKTLGAVLAESLAVVCA